MADPNKNGWLQPASAIKEHDDSDHWLSVSDLMAGLMMVFLFISVALMLLSTIEREKIKEVAVAYQENQVAIYNALVAEFDKDLDRWGAEIDKNTLAFNFHSPEVLFAMGDITLKDKYKDILQDFFPRYLEVLASYQQSIDEIRIEGHTSSVWNRFVTADEAYFKNMELSQGRTRAVLEYVYMLHDAQYYFEKDWIKKHIAAVGLSSSRSIVDDNGIENRERSRRVSFRVVTNAEVQIRRILEAEG